jgi:hypothetical protein
LIEKADDPGLMAMNKIIVRACEYKPQDRYQTASEMNGDLLNLKKQFKL